MSVPKKSKKAIKEDIDRLKRKSRLSVQEQIELASLRRQAKGMAPEPKLKVKRATIPKVDTKKMRKKRKKK